MRSKINLRRPEVMGVVQNQVVSHYQSDLVDYIKHHGCALSAGGLTVKLAKEFGFCYGVERAIDLAYAACTVFPNKAIYILGEIIHNPEVNHHLKTMGIKFLAGVGKDADIEDLKKDDLVIIPAFGAELSAIDALERKGCRFIDTTCGDVMSVWKRVRFYSKNGFTSIIHGKAWHEETKATSSRTLSAGNHGHYLVVFNLEETDYLCNYILNGGDKHRFLEKFKNAHSPGFDPDIHLNAVGVANQTTMLRAETEEVQRRLRATMEKKFGVEHLDAHFKSFDTICGATQERQNALKSLLEESLDLLIVIGGYNSSNTSHLAELGESKIPTFFIKNSAKIISEKLIHHYKLDIKTEIETRGWLPHGRAVVGITAGASCPSNLVEDVIRRLFQLRGVDVNDLINEPNEHPGII
ncbi:MAG: 4-hydroxy-3-methylbut-2-enyl diphosphate reductase [Verrucomicrobia bacterium]|nr:4-hydroxy-3-methylbut-2-enyl diphosphate reductase [Verrucomicrobiota bacterium]